MCTTPGKVLIVDDEAEVRELVGGLLEEAGWEILEGEDGDEGVALAAREMPDLVVLDVMMPAKDGFETLKELRENAQTNHIPVLMLSAVNEYDLGVHHDAESMGRELGVSPPQAFIEKPFHAREILDLVQRTAVN